MNLLLGRKGCKTTVSGSTREAQPQHRACRRRSKTKPPIQRSTCKTRNNVSFIIIIIIIIFWSLCGKGGGGENQEALNSTSMESTGALHTVFENGLAQLKGQSHDVEGPEAEHGRRHRPPQTRAQRKPHQRLHQQQQQQGEGAGVGLEVRGGGRHQALEAVPRQSREGLQVGNTQQPAGDSAQKKPRSFLRPRLFWLQISHFLQRALAAVPRRSAQVRHLVQQVQHLFTLASPLSFNGLLLHRPALSPWHRGDKVGVHPCSFTVSGDKSFTN